MAAFRYLQSKDSEIDAMLALRRADDTSPKPKRFFKGNSTDLQQVVQDQMSHVDKGCLSDPPASVVNLFRVNPVSMETFCVRGTNTNERDNFDLAYRIMIATHIGKYCMHNYCFDHTISHPPLCDYR